MSFWDLHEAVHFCENITKVRLGLWHNGVIKPLFAVPAFQVSPGSSPSSSTSNLFSAVVPGKAVQEGQSTWASTTLVGDPDGDPCSWLWLVLVLAQPYLLQLFGEWTSRWTSFVSLYHSTCQILFLTKNNTFKSREWVSSINRFPSLENLSSLHS